MTNKSEEELIKEDMEEYRKEQEEEERKDNEVIEEAKKLFSKEQWEEVETEIANDGYTSNFCFVDKCFEKEKSDDYKLIDLFIDQTVNGGYLGDEYAGYIYVKIPNQNRYLKWGYAM